MTNNYRTIETPFYGIVAKEILSAVHGQMSDGLWENSRGYEKYWTNFKVIQNPDNRVVFYISKDLGSTWCNRWISNPLREMSDSDFLAWFAGKLKAVIQAEARDNNWVKGWWDRDNYWQKTSYLNYKNEISVSDVYCVYDMLKGRICHSPESTLERCFSKPADTNTIAMRDEIKVKRAKIVSDYNDRVADAERRFKLEKEAAWEAYRAAMDELAKLEKEVA